MNNSAGLLEAWYFDGKGGARRLTPEEIRSSRPVSEGFRWLHFRHVPNRPNSWLETESGIDPQLVGTLMEPHARPTCTVMADGALMALRAVNLQPNSLPEELVTISMWVDAFRVVSVQHEQVSAVVDFVDAVGRGRCPRTQGEMIADLSLRLVERLDAVISALMDEADDLEDEAQREAPSDVMPRLSILRRVAMKLRRHISPQREALNHFAMEDDPWLGPKDRNRLRDAADRVARFSEELDSIRERTALIREQLVDRRAEQMNQSMLVLAVVTVVFAPLTLISGMLGMNVGGIPGSSDPESFWIISVMLVAMAAGMIWLFKRLNWI